MYPTLSFPVKVLCEPLELMEGKKVKETHQAEAYWV